jgi:hypothetical protein
VVAISALPGTAKAEFLSFTQTVVADFEFSLLGNTPLNNGPATPFIPFQAIGSLTFQLDPSLNDPGRPTTVPFTNLTGHIEGVSPAPFLPYTISPDVEFLGGQLTDIVRDLNGEVVSANIKDLSARWEMIGPGGLRLFTKVGLPFNGVISSLPLAMGTVIGGAADFEVFLDDGGSNPLVVIGRNRTLTVVPEPSGAALLGLGSLALMGLARPVRSSKP